MNIQIRNFSFGGTSAIVTNMGLITGFDQTTVNKSTMLSALLIVAIADNLTDSLSIHIYQESEQLAAREAFRATLANFSARLGLSLSFMFLVEFLPASFVAIVSIFWGLVLLIILTFVVAKSRKTPVIPEIWKHLGIAVAVILISKMIGIMVLK